LGPEGPNLGGDALSKNKDTNSLPWLVVGDFNEILYHYEKEGGRARLQRHLQAFHDALNDCALADMGYTGDIFTWHRGKMRERLDRGVVNAQWRNMFPSAELVNGEFLKSDHRPICVNTETSGVQEVRSNCRPRHFEARWLKEDTVQEMVQTAGRGP
jgi:endonuclease/exonuclease/phosphatase family metal-dependent hydrolase